MKKLVALLLTLTFVLSMCCAFAEYEQIDYNNTTLFGDVGPDGSVPGGLEDVMLTEEEKEQVRAGGYTVAICYHQLDNQVNQSKQDRNLQREGTGRGVHVEEAGASRRNRRNGTEA